MVERNKKYTLEIIKEHYTNVKAMKYLLKHTFSNLKVETIEVIGSGYDSIAYLVNEEYIFKMKISANKQKGYEKEKAILDFLNKNLKSSIRIPKIDYSYIAEELSILGYKKINGKILNPEMSKIMSLQ